MSVFPPRVCAVDAWRVAWVGVVGVPGLLAGGSISMSRSCTRRGAVVGASSLSGFPTSCVEGGMCLWWSLGAFGSSPVGGWAAVCFVVCVSSWHSVVQVGSLLMGRCPGPL